MLAGTGVGSPFCATMNTFSILFGLVVTATGAFAQSAYNVSSLVVNSVATRAAAATSSQAVSSATSQAFSSAVASVAAGAATAQAVVGPPRYNQCVKAH